MKVNIGKYPKRRWWHKFAYWHLGYEPKVKEKIVIEEFDTWSMDHTLAKIILPMLIQLKETKHGSPLIDDEDVPHLYKQGTSSNESAIYDLFASQYQDELFWNQYEERWEYVIGEMIWAFEQKVLDEWQSQYSKGEYDFQWTEVENGMSEMTAGPNHTFEVDDKGIKAHQERMTNGFRLFGKYYEGLWD